MPVRITGDARHGLFDVAGIRAIERAAIDQLPPHTLMQRAGLAVARLGLALAPHARTVWIAAGPGNNGGDGLEAAAHLARHARDVAVTWLGREQLLPADARASLQRARDAGVRFADQAPALGPQDLAIDALLGIGASRPPAAAMAGVVGQFNACAAVRLAVDLPTGLIADTGALAAPEQAHAHVRAQHTLSLLALKPGLFTGQGRDHAGQVWLDDLGCTTDAASAVAWLAVPPAPPQRLHASHKGSYGDVAVIGGAAGMAGAALLAARAALHAGAGRVFLGLLGRPQDGPAAQVDAGQPELMLRDPAALALERLCVVCGCGGGDSVARHLGSVLPRARQLVLDADALNALAAEPALQTLLRARGPNGQPTVLTPHPLEAARLLGRDTAAVQADRLAAASALARRFDCVVVLKGSGTLICAPGQVARINPSGNGRLATAGTGDVLAGMLGAALARSDSTWLAACRAVHRHGHIADRWPPDESLTAGALALAAGG